MRLIQREEENAENSEVKWEDQQQINAFSKLNTRRQNFLVKLKQLREDKEALDDLAMELELADEDEEVLYRVGETFLHLPYSKAMKRLEDDQKVLGKEVDSLSSQVNDCDQEMRRLKTVLYARFGSAINLDE